ncbi:MAG: septum site-determining protein MinD [Christensenellaceae bacterium]|jgi:septum site-determining protein MinD|nr:septum site-determining protein MinD [Christensenellaceae bacterium]
MARKIVITSGKGGVGKTTICANLGMHLAQMGLRVVLIDVDIGLNNLDVVMSIENKVVFDIVDVIENRCRVRQALIQDFLNSNLYTLPSVHSHSAVLVTGENIKKVIDNLATFFDYILIDCPAGIDAPFMRAIFGAQEAIVVVTPHLPSLRDADKVINLLLSRGIKHIGLIINRVRGDLIIEKEIMTVTDISQALNLPLLGVIPEDDKMAAGLIRTNSAGAFRAINMSAKNLHNNTDKIYDCTLQFKGIFGAIKRSLKKNIG